MTEVVLSSKGQMVIPKEVRESLGLKPGQRLEMEVLSDGTILIIPIPGDVVKADEAAGRREAGACTDGG